MLQGTPQSKVQQQGQKLVPSVPELRDQFVRLDHLLQGPPDQMLLKGVSWRTWKPLDISSHALPLLFGKVNHADQLILTLQHQEWPELPGTNQDLERCFKRNYVPKPADPSETLLSITEALASNLKEVRLTPDPNSLNSLNILKGVFHASCILHHFFAVEFGEMAVAAISIKEQKEWNERTSLVKDLVPKVRGLMEQIEKERQQFEFPQKHLLLSQNAPLLVRPYMIPSPPQILDSVRRLGTAFSGFIDGENLQTVRARRIRPSFMSYESYTVDRHWEDAFGKLAWSAMPGNPRELKLGEIREHLQKVSLVFMAVKWHLLYSQVQKEAGLPSNQRGWPDKPEFLRTLITKALDSQGQTLLRQLRWGLGTVSQSDLEFLNKEADRWAPDLSPSLADAIKLRVAGLKATANEDQIPTRTSSFPPSRHQLLEMRELLGGWMMSEELPEDLLNEIRAMAIASNEEKSSLWGVFSLGEAKRNDEVESALREMMYILNLWFERKVFEELADGVTPLYTDDQLKLHPY